MASSDKKRKGKRADRFSPSSGKSRMQRARQASVRVKMKIKRFERYQQEIEAGTRLAPLIKKGQKQGQVNADRWNTTGLQSHLSRLQGLVKAGKTV